MKSKRFLLQIYMQSDIKQRENNHQKNLIKFQF